ncbi:MAG: hypothetical protein JNN30_21170 [Rhodanobacteraceae bacterium]|nr:hypothetical protein [Rhodanobacteraceae bacterium]
MKYPSPDDIAEMQSRGFDISMIRDADEKSKRWYRGKQVIDRLRVAFAGVTLGDGVGLYQAQGLDDYAGQEELDRLRLNDEKHDWSRIPAAALNECHSSLRFFDPEGMRFHMPAFLIADISGDFHHGVDYHLCNPGDRFSLLSPQQREAVRQFMLYIAEEGDCEFSRPHILRALDEYWTE